MKIDDKNKKPPLYIFLHIPKTGGTTFSKHLLDGLKKETVIKFYSIPETGPIESLEKLKETINLLLSGKEGQEQIQAIYGHSIYLGLEKLFPDREIRYITFLRQPLNRIVSHYNFYRQKLEKGIRDKVITDLLKGEEGILSFEEAFLRNNILHNYTFKFLADHLFNTDLADKPENSYHDENVNRKILAEIKAVLNKFYFVGL